MVEMKKIRLKNERKELYSRSYTSASQTNIVSVIRFSNRPQALDKSNEYPVTSIDNRSTNDPQAIMILNTRKIHLFHIQKVQEEIIAQLSSSKAVFRTISIDSAM